MQDAIKQLSYFYRVLKFASSRQKIYLRFISLIKKELKIVKNFFILWQSFLDIHLNYKFNSIVMSQRHEIQ